MDGRAAKLELLSFSSIPTRTFHLAWLGLFDRAELRAGESVLIHAAAGGSGSAAVQLAKHAGARYVAITDINEYRLELARKLGVTTAWNMKDGSLHKKLDGHKNAVTAIAWFADSGRLVSSSSDNTAKIWDVASGKETATILTAGAA